jgi:hypothetical protein
LKKGPGYAFLPSLQATGSPPEIPLKYSEYANIFSEERANTLLNEHALHYAINFIIGHDLLYSPIYSLLKKELAILKDYINSSLEKGWI